MRTARTLLWGCVILFAARVVGQFEALLVAPDWLPDMDAWYSGLLPYPLLLPAQIAILMLMSVVAWNRRIRTGAFARAHPRAAGALRIFAGLYFVAWPSVSASTSSTTARISGAMARSRWRSTGCSRCSCW
jgi:hypothetical protein